MDVPAYLASEFTTRLRDSRFIDALPGDLHPNPSSQARMPILLQRLRELTYQ